jgi:hypothetical protein
MFWPTRNRHPALPVLLANPPEEVSMIRALIKAAAVAAVSSYAYRFYRSGRLAGLIGDLADRLDPRLAPGAAPALEGAYSGANASRPAPAHPWPVDRQSLGKGAPVPDAA